MTTGVHIPGIKNLSNPKSDFNQGSELEKIRREPKKYSPILQTSEETTAWYSTVWKIEGLIGSKH